jgi:hypothetical protein
MSISHSLENQSRLALHLAQGKLPLQPTMSANDIPPGSTLDQVRAAKHQALGTFKRLGDVTGVGITRIGKGYGLKINLKERPVRNVPFPTTIKGVPVLVEVVGPLKKRLAV